MLLTILYVQWNVHGILGKDQNVTHKKEKKGINNEKKWRNKIMMQKIEAKN